MNYNEFIKSVDEKLLSMSEREKEKWIHNMARTTRILNVDVVKLKNDFLKFTKKLPPLRW